MNTRRPHRAGWVLRAAALAVPVWLAGPGCSRHAQPDLHANATQAASEIHRALPASRPGFGTTDYPGHAEGDVPKAYAMVLLAEVERLGTAWRSGEANLARTAGEWLLAHADEDGDGVTGWGLPVAWDAYDDGSTNPAHTEYTITTAIVIDALMTWAERDAGAPHARIREVVRAAVEPYLDAATASPSGMAPYSLTAADRRYDTFNPAAYLAGQIQRASLGVRDAATRARYEAAADRTMAALLRHRQLVPGSGHWYWNYSVQQALPNDLPHAGYVIAGVRDYLAHGGRLAERFDWPAVLGHLGDFKGEAGELRAFPMLRKGIKLAARSYDLGFALHLACTEARAAPLVPWLLAAVPAYRTPAARYLKYPPGKGGNARELVVNEYEAYLYRGLTTCTMAPGVLKRGRTDSEEAQAPVVALSGGDDVATLARGLAGPPARTGDTVPLLPASAGLVQFDATRKARVALADATTLALPDPGVPVHVLPQGQATFVFLRRHPDNHLALLRFEGERLTCRLDVQHGEDPTAVAMLRAATVHEGRLHAVIYHNPSLANWQVAWDTEAPCPKPLGPPARLPSLGEPAGATYEMVPGLRFHPDPHRAGRLWLVGGNVQMQVGPAGQPGQAGEGGPAAVQRIEGCRHVLETAVTPSGPAHLCIAAAVDPRALARQPFVKAPPGVAAPEVDLGSGVPWNLRWSLGALQIDHARHPYQLRRLLRHDLARTAPGGWMEFGVNNEEGRIPWSQIYYLNGLMDLLDLARRDAGALALYGPLLAEARQRLDMEMQWLDEHVRAGRHRTRAFTVDRSRALFGVQTGRLLLVLHRYRTEVPDALPTPAYEVLKRAVPMLEDHIEVMASEGEETKWIAPGRHHLRWPKGSKFAFDGMPVPYNHQNEWAHAVLATADAATPPLATEAATDVLRHFVDRIAPGGRLPDSGSWDYWWGRAFDGWDAAAGWSVNTRRYGGDRIKAWISFRTIDAMALVAAAPKIGAREAEEARRSAMALAARGLLYPFANHAWVDTGQVHLAPAVAQEYARVSAPWELANAAWSLAVLARRAAP
ncbi:MAG: hypothetical protein KIT17_03480 [Rubrivivax sp.]|nr:hypothetical protein [Rubrivivax sp.]